MSSQNHVRPKVLIVGAGLAGLLLGALLERIHIPFHIYERASHLRAQGSVITLGANVLTVFEQLGLLDDLHKISLPSPALDIFYSDKSKLGTLPAISRSESGYDNLVFERAQLLELLRKQVPSNKITFNKRVIETDDKGPKVFIHCADGSRFEGDIVVGADGAYSGVRRQLYHYLEDHGLLPSSDIETSPAAPGYAFLVGVAEHLSLEKYPQLRDDFSHFTNTVGEHGEGWSAVTTKNKHISWGVWVEVNETETLDGNFHNGEWGPDANDHLIKRFRNKPTPLGGTLGDLFDATPKDRISHVVLQEKVFKTWHYGRTVLLGDAAHKMHITSGLGTATALHDAVVLANCIHDLPDSSSKSIHAAFQEYYTQRHVRATEQLVRSKSIVKFMGGQTWLERLCRYAVVNYLPTFIQHWDEANMLAYRPQVAWLPLVQKKGTSYVLPQEGRRVIDEVVKAL
ncbi:hypothetical protein EDD11_008955 [Mortierella claussenii]|nr:hypothetical protein EDD11_008955 [Mortierella claussenii]